MVACKEKKSMELSAGIDYANIDTTATAGDDFYQYACGGWLKNNPLTDEYSSYGSFDMLAENNRKQLNELIDSIVRIENVKGSNAQKIADLYNMVMDTARRNSEGIAVVKSVLDRIATIDNRSDILKEMTELFPYGVGGFFDVGLAADLMNSKMNIVSISQGGLSLGSKEYYFDDDDATTAIREAFKKHVVRMFILFGYDKATATKKMNAVWAIEMRIAEKSYYNVQLRDIPNNYHKISYADLKKDFSGIDWDTFFSILGL